MPPFHTTTRAFLICENVVVFKFYVCMCFINVVVIVVEPKEQKIELFEKQEVKKNDLHFRNVKKEKKIFLSFQSNN
mgnify:CR=1 FL=1